MEIFLIILFCLAVLVYHWASYGATFNTTQFRLAFMSDVVGEIIGKINDNIKKIKRRGHSEPTDMG
tara:strand:- start:318 stop:515 length:198 start_codon:yes stop_codon:yes gene_type:complete